VSTRTRSRSPKPARADLPPGACLCDHCVGKCCRYFCLQIDTPNTWDDFDSIRWYLAHGQTLVYVEGSKWYLVVGTWCGYLLADNRCAIYHDRPRICREYTTDECEYDSEWSFEKVFHTPEQVWEYAEAVLPPRRRRKAEATPPGPLVTIGPPPARG
jgi:Fe-S-cluster containining protein